jgi:hypothetical protein
MKRREEKRKEKKRKALQAKSSCCEQGSLAVFTEPKPRESRNILCQTIRPFKPDLPNQGSFSPVPINSYPPSTRQAESPSSTTVMAHRALCSSNPLIAWSGIGVTVANSLPNRNFIILLYKSQQGSRRNCKPLINPFQSHLP